MMMIAVKDVKDGQAERVGKRSWGESVVVSHLRTWKCARVIAFTLFVACT